MKFSFIKSFKVLVSCSVLALAISAPIQVIAADSADSKPFTSLVSAEGLVPLREVAEAVGAQITWDALTEHAVIVREDKKLAVTNNEQEAMINGVPYSMSLKARMIDDKMMISIDAINKAFGIDLKWNEKLGVQINSKDMQSLAAYFIYLLNHNQVDRAQAMMSDSLKKVIPPATLQFIWKQGTAFMGNPVMLKKLVKEENAVHTSIALTYETDKQTSMWLTLRFNEQGQLDDVYSPPGEPVSTYQKPTYDKPDAYLEKEVVVGSGEFALPGTLTIPKVEGPFPVVVLVQGSGENDRDESILAYKPFRDLAVGLADKKIAVLRYEKRTREHTWKTEFNPQYSVKEETVDDALLAVKLLQSEKNIDPKRIYVAGHSQGGMLIPRIIEADQAKAIAGTVIMSSPSDSYADMLKWHYGLKKEQMKAASLPTEMAQYQIDLTEQIIKILKDPQYSLSALPKEFPMGNPHWWFDFGMYLPGEQAKKQNGPLLIMQGGFDGHVSSKSLNSWKQALAARSDVSYKMYDKLNHFYVETDKLSNGTEYVIPGNVPSYVIDDLADWILKQK